MQAALIQERKEDTQKEPREESQLKKTEEVGVMRVTTQRMPGITRNQRDKEDLPHSPQRNCDSADTLTFELSPSEFKESISVVLSHQVW